MKTQDIIESLNMAAVSRNGIPNGLLHDIADALKERDFNKARADDLTEALAHDAEQVAQLSAQLETVQMRYDIKAPMAEALAEALSQSKAGNDQLSAQLETAVSHLRAIVSATYGYADATQPIIDAERWLGQMAANEVQS